MQCIKPSNTVWWDRSLHSTTPIKNPAWSREVLSHSWLGLLLSYSDYVWKSRASISLISSITGQCVTQTHSCCPFVGFSHSDSVFLSLSFSLFPSIFPSSQGSLSLFYSHHSCLSFSLPEWSAPWAVSKGWQRFKNPTHPNIKILLGEKQERSVLFSIVNAFLT